MTWEEMRGEIIERLNNPTNEQIALYIEAAYKLGYKKGIRVGVKELEWLRAEVLKELRRL